MLILQHFWEKCGNTGNSTGTHLHLECSTSQAWNCQNFVNPGDYLGIPNIRGTIVEYNGEINPNPPTPTPTPTISNSKKWLMSRAFKINIKFNK